MQASTMRLTIGLPIHNERPLSGKSMATEGVNLALDAHTNECTTAVITRPDERDAFWRRLVGSTFGGEHDDDSFSGKRSPGAACR